MVVETFIVETSIVGEVIVETMIVEKSIVGKAIVEPVIVDCRWLNAV